MADRPVILGLDPAMNKTGWACCDLRTGTPILCSSWNIEKQRKTKELHWCIMDAAERLAETLGERGLAPAVIYAEKHFVGRSKSGTINLAEALGIHVLAVALMFNAPVNRFRPSEWKNAIGLPGNATKPVCIQWAHRQGWDFPLGDDDAGEAACIASAGFNFNERGDYGSHVQRR